MSTDVCPGTVQAAAGCLHGAGCSYGRFENVQV